MNYENHYYRELYVTVKNMYRFSYKKNMIFNIDDCTQGYTLSQSFEVGGFIVAVKSS